MDCEGICRFAHGHQPGSINDIESFYFSDLYQRRHLYLGRGDKILADGIYARIEGHATGPFIVPVCYLNRPFTIAEERYNELQAWGRSVVEHFFSRLKGLCHILFRYTFSSEVNINVIVGCAFIVTNIVIKYQHPLRA